MDTGFRRRVARLTRRWKARWSDRQARWLTRRVPPVTQLKLSQRTIFILPTWQGVFFGLGAIILLVIAIVERNLVSLSLSALMLSIFLLSLILCYRNLSGLRLTTQVADDAQRMRRCFVGDTAQFTVVLSAPDRRRPYQDIWLGLGTGALQRVSVAAGGMIEVTLEEAAERRGIVKASRLLLRTRYPAGLWQSWSRPDLLMRCLVYPRPQACTLPLKERPVPTTGLGRQAAAVQAGVEDFAGLRDFQPGDSARRVAWQSLARGQGLKTKQFVQDTEPQVLLTFDDFIGREAEAILACLCFQVLKLSRSGRAVGLRLPGTVDIRPGQGEAHKHQLLQALALWN